LIATLSGLAPLELAVGWTLVAIAAAVAGLYPFTNPPRSMTLALPWSSRA